jgi:hypothetical protein
MDRRCSVDGSKSFIVGIDPGPVVSGYVCFQPPDRRAPIGMGGSVVPNERILDYLAGWANCGAGYSLAVEMVSSYGVQVGKSTIDTIWWAGRFAQAAEAKGMPQIRVYRSTVRAHMFARYISLMPPDPACKRWPTRWNQVGDPHVMRGLWARFGGSKAKAVGTKKKPGPLYGLKGHMWAALAVAVTAYEKGLI